MSVSYNIFTEAFLDKVTEFDFPLDINDRENMLDRFMKRAIAAFKHMCVYDLSTTNDDANREFGIDIATDDIDEIVDIVSEGMIVQWLKPYVYRSESLENILNTRDYTAYSPAELLFRIRETHTHAVKHFTELMREYSFNHGDLTKLHL